ncbi:hypothetical protein, partial [Streptococcus suis]|uniref:hypothetical protein n=1 Tax=Streptococcus suis TaxID=1307 RepID=UPI0029C1F71C
LRSYEAERLPIARRNRDHVKKCAAAAFEPQFPISEEALSDTVVGQARRNELAREFEAKTSRLYESLGVEIGYRYLDSPVIHHDSGAMPAYDE